MDHGRTGLAAADRSENDLLIAGVAWRLAAHVDDTALPPELAERRASHLIIIAWSHYLCRDHRGRRELRELAGFIGMQ